MRHQPLEILLVEDNDDDVVLVREAFRELRLLNLMHVVRDGQQAVDYLRRSVEPGGPPRPGLVLMDLNMPRKNGLEALLELKEDARTAPIPVVMMTVSEREEDVVQSYRVGACSYLRKPVALDGLVRMMKEVELYWALVALLPPTE